MLSCAYKDITVELPNTSAPGNTANLTIFNINVQVILQRRITEPQTLVDVSGLNAGIYFVRVISIDGVMVGKLVKK